MPKSKDAFRTISEVADWLDVQPHVLRFWESKFSQVRPVKRACGRRYYRPNDMLLIGGIKQLLHDDGMTIKGVQKLLRDKGISEISALSRAIDTDDAAGTGDTVTIEKNEADKVVAKTDLPPKSAPSTPKSADPKKLTAKATDSAPIEASADKPVPAPTASPKKPQTPLVTEAPSWEIRRKIILRLTEIHELDPASKPEIAKAVAALAQVPAKHKGSVTP